jgi:hypothetical protein
MPGLQEAFAVFRDDLFNPTQLSGSKSEIPGERYFAKPELRRLVVAIDMNVRRLVGFMTVEVKPIWTVSQNRWCHVPPLRRNGFRNPSVKLRGA